MVCPFCKEKLKRAIFCGVEIDYCPVCLGMFLPDQEICLTEDKKDAQLGWLDIHLWQDEEKFKGRQSKKLCPHCRLPLFEFQYREAADYPLTRDFSSGITVNICPLCKGIWLEREEFKKITAYLKGRADYEILENWARTLRQEFWETFLPLEEEFLAGEIIQDEFLDFFLLFKLLSYKFTVRHSLVRALNNFISQPAQFAKEEKIY